MAFSITCLTFLSVAVELDTAISCWYNFLFPLNETLRCVERLFWLEDARSAANGHAVYITSSGMLSFSYMKCWRT